MQKNSLCGLYIHIPFCLRKCPYCDFYSIPIDDAAADMYTNAVCASISSGVFVPGSIDTIYFGGGTPSIFGAKRLGKILDTAAKSFDICTNAEITLEANPASSSEKRFGDFKSAGFNRISIGVQSAADSELLALGRPHNADNAKAAVMDAYTSGFDNISCDLMLGIPSQTEKSMLYSIDFLAALPITHVSSYLLKIEEGTAFEKSGIAKICPDEDMAADLYLACVERLSELGFAQYEISNFAKNGKKSRHNLKYWELAPYLGIGPGAHSFLGGKRFYFSRDIAEFTANPTRFICDNTESGGFEEYAMLRLRLSEGLCLEEANNIYNANPDDILHKADVFIKNGMAIYKNGHFSLTPRGFLLSNTIINAIML